jgi:major type 1 subunit fimbrin (pilin)
MNIKHVLAALVAAGVSNAAMAVNTITFTGVVDAQTCTVAVGGSANPTVTLPTVGASELAALGNTAGATPFTVDVTGCTAGPDNVSIRLTTGSPATNGTLTNTGSASNVAVQLVDSGLGGSAIDLTSGIATVVSNLPNGVTSTSHNFAARYYATGAAGAGTVSATVNYELIYP